MRLMAVWIASANLAAVLGFLDRYQRTARRISSFASE
jgi:hypothetical protein